MLSLGPMSEQAEILVIGDELLSGETCDTNSSWLDAALDSAGWVVGRHVTVPDDLEAIAEAFDAAARRSRLVISSGGLGPTRDDLTLEGLARALGVPLRRDEATIEAIKQRFAHFGREMTPNNERQAMVPASGEVLTNEVGTAPGFHAQLHGADVFLVPGVPREVRWLFEHAIKPRIDRGHPATLRRTLKVIGIGESRLEHSILEIIRQHPRVRWGFRTLGMENHVKLAAEPADLALLDAAEAAVRAALGAKIYGAGDVAIEVVLGERLIARKETVAVAESCTGGLVAKRLTDVAGSSAYVLGGVVAYANAVKMSMLGVEASLLDGVGAVSAEVAAAMASGVRARFSSTWGLSATGIAGPGGGTRDKPVGLVYVALAGPDGVETRELKLPGDRTTIREQTASALLDWLRRRVSE